MLPPAYWGGRMRMVISYLLFFTAVGSSPRNAISTLPFQNLRQWGCYVWQGGTQALLLLAEVYIAGMLQRAQFFWQRCTRLLSWECPKCQSGSELPLLILLIFDLSRDGQNSNKDLHHAPLSPSSLTISYGQLRE